MWLQLVALAAHAEVPAQEPPRDIEVGAGLFFNAGGVFMTQPPDNKDGDPGLPYNGFAGFSPGGGLQLEGRVKGIVGLELDFTRWHQVGQSEFTINGTSYPWQITQNAWQVPLLFKLTAPVGIVRPNLFVGPEFVLVGKTAVTPPAWPVIDPPDLTASSDSYTLLTFGLGFEAAIPIEGVDLRIPFAIRLSDDLGTPVSAYDRATYYVNDEPWDQTSAGTLTRIDYHTAWKYQAAVTLGVSYWFL